MKNENKNRWNNEFKVIEWFMREWATYEEWEKEEEWKGI